MLHAYSALSDCAEASTMFWHRGCPVAAVMSADAAVQVKVDFIRGPCLFVCLLGIKGAPTTGSICAVRPKSTPCRICPAATEKWE